MAAARSRGIPVWSEIELGARLVRQPDVGITGTNGKTTTSELVGAILRADGRHVSVAGNVGRPLCGLDGELAADEAVVCELSSFQLEDIEALRPHVAVLLNLTPDHLDRHGSLAGYRAAKLRIFENQARRATWRSSRAVSAPFRDRGTGSSSGRRTRSRQSPSFRAPTTARTPLRPPRLPALLGVGDEAIAEALRSFPGVRHRLEPIREVAGVRFVNDSKATNPESAERALAAFPPGLRVILGGSRKGTPFASLARTAREHGVARAYLIGETASDLARELDREGVPYAIAGDLATAVAAAFADAAPGEVVLLSPACASFDQFDDFEHRGESFRALVETL